MYPTALTGDSNLYGQSVEDLPELPGRPEYPMHQLTDQQLQKYIIPLYSRQWRINYTFKKAIVDSRQWFKSATLCRTYEFYSFERMMDFVTEIAKISQKEAVSLIAYRSDMPFSQFIALPCCHIRGKGCAFPHFYRCCIPRPCVCAW